MAQEPLETHLLETFVEVARTGSVTEAARSLHRSQPAVSHRLSALEERFGVPLFEKVGRGLRLTEYGRRLRDEATDLLARLTELPRSVVGNPERLTGAVRVGTLPTLGRHWLLSSIVDVMTDHPLLRLSFRFGMTDVLLSELRRGQLDLVVVVGSVPQAGMVVRQLGEVRVVAAMSPDHVGDMSRLTLRKLREMRYLAWQGPADPTFDAVRRFAEEKELVDETTSEFPHIETLRALAAAGVGYALLPDYTTASEVADGQLVTFPVPGLAQRFPVYLLTRENQVLGPASEAVRKAIAN